MTREQSAASIVTVGWHVVIAALKITRMAHSQEVRDALLMSSELEDCRIRVMDAQCLIKPEWAHGATCLVPFTEGQLVDLNSAGRELEPQC